VWYETYRFEKEENFFPAQGITVRKSRHPKIVGVLDTNYAKGVMHSLEGADF
jgi:hypothetical protein